VCEVRPLRLRLSADAEARPQIVIATSPTTRGSRLKGLPSIKHQSIVLSESTAIRPDLSPIPHEFNLAK